MKTNNIAPTPPVPVPRVEYALHRRRRCWDLTFAGRQSSFRHERGALYLAHLLAHPAARPIHGLLLALTVRKPCDSRGIHEIIHPGTGCAFPVERTSVLLERNLDADNAEALRRLRARQKELERLVQDPDETEPVKREASEELADICEFQKRRFGRTRRAAYKAADGVGKALKRLCRHLAAATDSEGRPDEVLRAFAAHLKSCLLIPSGRAPGSVGHRAREGFGGCFTYEPATDVRWEL